MVIHELSLPPPKPKANGHLTKITRDVLLCRCKSYRNFNIGLQEGSSAAVEYLSQCYLYCSKARKESSYLSSSTLVQLFNVSTWIVPSFWRLHVSQSGWGHTLLQLLECSFPVCTLYWPRLAWGDSICPKMSLSTTSQGSHFVDV